MLFPFQSSTFFFAHFSALVCVCKVKVKVFHYPKESAEKNLKGTEAVRHLTPPPHPAISFYIFCSLGMLVQESLTQCPNVVHYYITGNDNILLE